ncbi:MAG: phosphoadenosine phosphosulfate reductase family protein [Cyclobacteriaceae bacterium]
MRCYIKKNVVQATIERLNYIFDRYEDIVVSVSGGKDSQLMFELTHQIARERGREFHVYFLDQEAEYQATIDVVKSIMTRDGVIPNWYQVPIYLTNATSQDEEWLYAWGEGEKWMREKDPLAIHEIKAEYPKRFYKFISWFEKQWGDNAAFLVGLRAEESLNRYRAVIKNPGVDDILWSTAGDTIKFYPIYDWSFDDVFLYFYQNNIRYNRIYDYMHVMDPGMQIRKMRVSNLIHEKAFKALTSLQVFEPETFDKLQKRLKGVHTAAIYANESSVYNNMKRPGKFSTWKEYRDHLLNTSPTHFKQKFIDRFAKQPKKENIYKQQVKQLLLNDWENNIPVQDKTEETEKRLEYWRTVL